MAWNGTIFFMIFGKKYEEVLITSLRLILAVIFIWFGALKILGYNPVFELIHNSAVPALAYGNGLIILGVAETLIGLMLLINRAVLFTHIVLVLHLLGTFSTFVFGWGIIFDPYFPILSLDGEFVIKNIVLVVASLLVLVQEAKRRKQA